VALDHDAEGAVSAPERERLLGAFAELLAERGYEAVGIEAICGRAGVDVGVFATHFGGDKERCAAAAENAILSEVVAAVGRSYSADRSEWDNVVACVKAILDVMVANPGLAYLGYIGGRQMAPPGVLEIYEAGHQMLEAMLERGQAYATSANAPPRAALAALGGAEAIIRREIAAGRTAQLPRLLPDFVYSATVPFLGQEEALRLARQGRELLTNSPGGLLSD